MGQRPIYFTKKGVSQVGVDTMLLISSKGAVPMKLILGIVIGGAIGFAVGYFGKCASGVCPLTSNPVISTILGAIIGALVTMGR